MDENDESGRQHDGPLIGAANKAPLALSDTNGEPSDRLAGDGNTSDEPVEEEPGADPIQTLLNRRYPRVALHRDTLRLLQRVEWMNRNQGVNDFCNDAIRYVIVTREAGTVTLNDLHAVSAALDARLDELSVVLLHLHQAVGDLSLLVEHQRLIGAYGERLRQAAATARHK